MIFALLLLFPRDLSIHIILIMENQLKKWKMTWKLALDRVLMWTQVYNKVFTYYLHWSIWISRIISMMSATVMLDRHYSLVPRPVNCLIFPKGPYSYMVKLQEIRRYGPRRKPFLPKHIM